MTIERKGLLLALAMGIAAPGCAGRIGTIAFQGTGSSCVVVQKPKKIVVNTNNFQEQFLGMAWVIHNACGQEAEVSISPIERKKQSVLDCGPGGMKVKVPKGKVGIISCLVVPKIENEDTDGKYRYSISLNGNPVDPDLIIKRR